MSVPTRRLLDSNGADAMGEVQASPTANTLLARLKEVADGIDEVKVLIGAVTASPTENTILERLKTLETTIVLAAGSNAIGKLAANTGVDIGDVDILSIAAGTNLIGKVGIDQTTANANEVVVKSITAGDTNIGNVDIVTDASGAYTTPTHTQPSIGATTTAALASNANRLYALLVNDSVETIYIKLGADAVLNQGIRLNANGGSYEMSKKFGNLYTGAINGICVSGSMALLVTEGV